MRTETRFDVLTDGLDFPEGPVVLPDGDIVLVEIAAGAVTRIDPKRNKRRIATMPGAPNGLALAPDGYLYCCNAGDTRFHMVNGVKEPHGTPDSYSGGSIWRVHPEHGKPEMLFETCDGRPLRGPNDLVVDATGGFYFTDLGKAFSDERKFGGVYYVPADRSTVQAVLYPFDFANGIGLSPDGGTLYVAQTMAARLWAFTVLAPGKIEIRPDRWEKGRLVASLPGATGFDSLAVDDAGSVYVATLNAGCITKLAASGMSPESFYFPDRYVTNVCFGLFDPEQAFVTLSSTGRLIKTRFEPK